MEILCFKVKGKLAHFRKYYANNTAFSFSIPPRTTMMGIIAAIMGWKKDEYYENLSSENFQFAVRVITPLKKGFHRLNFLSIKNLGDLSKNLDSDFRGRGGRIQTPFEIVSGLDIRKDEVKYQIFLKSSMDGQNLFQKIKSHFLNDRPVFNVSLGIASFSASIYEIQLLSNKQISEHNSEDIIKIHSAIPSDKVVELHFEKDLSNSNFIEEDLFPAEFIGNHNRELKKINRLLFSVTDSPLSIKLSCKYYKLNTLKEDINIVFVDE